MKKYQWGLGGLQVLMSVAIVGVIGVVAVPKYNAFMDKAKLTEAFTIAGASKRKLTEFHMMNGRFPQTYSEAESMETTTMTAPEYVKDVYVEPEHMGHEIIVKVYIKNGVLENLSGDDQFVYIAGDSVKSGGAHVEWTCGAENISAELLPEDCKS